MTAYLKMRQRPKGVCQSCRTEVEWDGKRWKVSGERVAHLCEGQRCNAPLPRLRGERCWRKPHREDSDHRSEYAIRNRREAARKWKR